LEGSHVPLNRDLIDGRSSDRLHPHGDIPTRESSDIVLLVDKWFVFWAVGVRQLLAGLRQVIRPQLTAESIFGIGSSAPWPIVRELEFTNLSMGVLGILSLAVGGLTRPSRIVSGLFFAIAGVKHLLRRRRKAAENVAVISDLFLFAVLLFFGRRSQGREEDESSRAVAIHEVAYQRCPNDRLPIRLAVGRSSPNSRH
jgi:Family of unknown function (DUF6790)